MVSRDSKFFGFDENAVNTHRSVVTQYSMRVTERQLSCVKSIFTQTNRHVDLRKVRNAT